MNIIIPSNILAVLDVLRNSGFEGYLVGGCVRDAAMGKHAHDFDITTNALPDEIIKCFSGYRIIETGLKHGTVTVVSDGENVEITTYRIDGAYVDNRRPESVSFTSLIDEDLSRRDFTVNAMAYNPYDGYVDIFGGINDLKAKVIKCVGNPDKRFGEDGLRIMRAMRFASVLDFEIHKETSESIHRNKLLLKNISSERIYVELKKLICGIKAIDVLEEYYDVMCVIFPVLEHKKDLYFQNIRQLKNLENDYVVRLACILNNFEQSQVRDFMKQLKPDNDTLKKVLTLTSYSQSELKSDGISIRYLMSSVSDELIRKIAALKRCFEPDFKYNAYMDAYTVELSENPCVSIKQLAVNGNDLIKYGVAPGRNLGETMEKILSAVIENKCENTKESIFSFLNISDETDNVLN